MRDPSTWLGMWPESQKDRIAMSVVLGIVPLAVLFETLIIIPYYTNYGTHEFWWTMAVVAFILVNFYGNLFKLITVDPSGVKTDLPSVLRAGFRYCARCKLNAPPRAYHCPTCDTCIWKRDHHCSFAGTCVGYWNQRYYLMATVFGWIGTIYANWWHWTYVWEAIGGLRLGTVWFMFVPHIALVTQFINIKQFVLLGFQMTGICCGVFCFYLFGAQMMCISRGQTRPEFLLGIRSFDQGPLTNLRQVLGKRWYLAVWCPFLPSPMEGDGQLFERKTHKLETVKDL